MKDLWKTIKTGMLFFALPLVATAAASAHTWASGEAVITPAATVTSSTELVAERSLAVNLDAEGYVNGRVVAIDAKNNAVGIDALKVKFVRNGNVEKVVFTEKDGSFRVKGLSEGSYSFIASNKSAFVAHGVNVVKASGSDVLVTAAISPGFSRIYDIISTEVQSKTNAHKNKTALTEIEVPTVSGNRIQVIDGMISGKIYAANSEDIQNTKIYLFQNQTQIAQVSANQAGEFSFDELAPGVYSFVAAGPNGFAAASFVAEELTGIPARQISFSNGTTTLITELPVILNDPNAQSVVENSQDEIIVVQPSVQVLGDQGAFGAVGEEFFVTNETDVFSPMFGHGGGGVGHHNWVAKGALIAAIIALADDDGDLDDATPANLNN